ncbi:hypothetical protein CANCADRAFT_57000 [Tortispora caseinolytica NRRL Y-17796]|uniref:Glutathione reductase n=1 Tax=Tortispora caseinolytica NRRL Y-17796 TaxID=767744 RepID=A0A1E4TFE1_9ASCO|nr:hypothetical protein CANCADRAFT_57000 [Tortispora caseinolytica NRRL Y-17796]
MSNKFDLVVIGGGSGGLATARRAAGVYGARAAIVECGPIGGTCVNVGCVPKKVMWSAAAMAESIKQAPGYGFDVTSKPFNWPEFVAKRTAYIHRLNGIYFKNLENDKVTYFHGKGYVRKEDDLFLVDVRQEDGSVSTIKADRVVIATGSYPILPKTPGAELGITSNGFFELTEQPKTVLVVGAGYIGVELSGMLHALGSETHLMIRGDTVLRSFDEMIQTTITETYEKEGIKIHTEVTKPIALSQLDSGKTLASYVDKDGKASTLEVDKVIWAIGRAPHTRSIGLEEIGVKMDETGYIEVDKYQNTSVPNLYALGDVVKLVHLTPVAIAAGRRLVDRVFGGVKDRHLDYDNIPSAIFSHPEAGSVGLSEKAAIEKFGKDQVKVYKTKFNGMYYAVLEEKIPTAYKMVCVGPEEKVVGLHLVGDASAELIQGFGVAVKMGATKEDFDNTVAVHPTSAEEVVTLK